jgi:hypothetical protein
MLTEQAPAVARKIFPIVPFTPPGTVHRRPPHSFPNGVKPPEAPNQPAAERIFQPAKSQPLALTGGVKRKNGKGKKWKRNSDEPS